jgi:hypothetical protein
MKTRTSPATICAALLGIAASRASFADSLTSFDESTAGKWSTTLWGGADFAPRSRLQSALAGETFDLGVLDPSFAGDAATTAAARLNFRDAFKVGPAFALQTDYGMTDQLDSFVRLGYSQLRGRNLEFGSITTPALATPVAINGNFADRRSVDLTAGLHYAFQTGSPLRPYIGGYVGVDRTNALRLALTTPALATNPGSNELIGQRTSFETGLEGGLSWALSNNAELSFSVGAEYVNSGTSNSTALAPLGLASVALRDRQWTYPTAIGVTYRF